MNFGLGSVLPRRADRHRDQRGWYDHWLKELPATEAHESGVLLFVMGVNEWRARGRLAAGAGRGHRRSTCGDGLPRAGTRLRTDRRRVRTTSTTPPTRCMTRGGNIILASEYPAGPFDQRDVEAATTYWCSPPAARQRPRDHRPGPRDALRLDRRAFHRLGRAAVRGRRRRGVAQYRRRHHPRAHRAVTRRRGRRRPLVHLDRRSGRATACAST